MDAWENDPADQTGCCGVSIDHGVVIRPDMDSSIWDLQMLSEPGRRELIWMCFQKERGVALSDEHRSGCGGGGSVPPWLKMGRGGVLTWKKRSGNFQGERR